jgi:hypothetical protein
MVVFTYVYGACSRGIASDGCIRTDKSALALSRLRATLPAVNNGFGHHLRPKQSGQYYYVDGAC